MKQIKVYCDRYGKVRVDNPNILLDGEHNSIDIVVSMAGLGLTNHFKRLDILVGKDKTVGFLPSPYDYPIGDVLTVTLTSAHLKSGYLRLQPVAFIEGDGGVTEQVKWEVIELKTKYSVNANVATTSIQVFITDYINNLLTVKSVTATTLAPSEPATLNFTIESDGVSVNAGIPRGLQGIQGTQGVKGNQWRGAYSDATTYVVDDVVSYNGSSYICILASTNNLPTNVTYWSLFATTGTAIASNVTNTPSGNISATNVQAALNELDTEKVDKTKIGLGLRPDVFAIKCNAGLMAFSWNNPSGRYWIFPKGTVTNVGATPIATSTAEKPDVIIPTGGGTVYLFASSWQGTFNMDDSETNSQYIGSLADLPPLTSYLSLFNCPLVTGSLADLPPLTSYLSLYNCSLVTGSLADLPPLTNTLSLYNCSLVTGSLADLPPLTNYLSLFNCSLVTGSYTVVNGNNIPTITILTGTGMSATDMDNTLIAYANCTKNNGSFTATGKTRTSASDSAVATLVGRGWTISGLTVV